MVAVTLIGKGSQTRAMTQGITLGNICSLLVHCSKIKTIFRTPRQNDLVFSLHYACIFGRLSYTAKRIFVWATKHS